MTETAELVAPSLHEAVRLLLTARRIAVIAHVNPDADAIGSVLGITGGLKALGKQVVPALSDPVPAYARFLSGADAIVSHLSPDPFDVYLFADSAGIERVGDLYLREPERFRSATILNLDHHHTNPRFGTVNYVDPGASSTAEMAFRLLRALDAPIDSTVASALLFGIVGDTGSFQNGATTPGALETAGELIRLGADSQRIAYQLFDRKTYGAARLWGRVLSRIDLDRPRRIVFACLEQAMLAGEGATMDEVEGVAEYLRGIEEADVVMLLKETQDSAIRVSMRSRPGVDVAVIATVLGGGGHRQAAGCTIAGTFAEARAALTETFDRFYPR